MLYWPFSEETPYRCPYLIPIKTPPCFIRRIAPPKRFGVDMLVFSTDD
jgi:hypothetical protein